MGYESIVTGWLRVTPKFTEDQIADLGLGVDDTDGIELVGNNVGEDDTVGVVDGEITVIPGLSWTHIECRLEEPYKAYHIGDSIDSIVAHAKGTEREVEGALYVQGENSLDLSRYRVENGKVVHEEPTLTWPNGDEGWR